MDSNSPIMDSESQTTLEQKAAATVAAASAAGAARSEEAAEVVTGPARVDVRANVTVPQTFCFPGRVCELSPFDYRNMGTFRRFSLVPGSL